MKDKIAEVIAEWMPVADKNWHGHTDCLCSDCLSFRTEECTKAILDLIAKELPKEEDFAGKSFQVPKLDRDIMKDPWFTEGIKIGIRETLKDIKHKLDDRTLDL